MRPHPAEHRRGEMNQCIEDCLSCATTCIETINHCLSVGGAHAAPEHIGIMQTCAEICSVSAHAMLRGVQAHTATCSACATICRQCAESCESMGEDEAMRRCADACRRCAESCRAMSAGM